MISCREVLCCLYLLSSTRAIWSPSMTPSSQSTKRKMRRLAQPGTWTNQRSASSSGPITAHLDDDGAEELGAGGAELQHAGGDSLALHQGRRVDQLVLLQIPAHTTIVINDILQPSKRASKEKKDDNEC